MTKLKLKLKLRRLELKLRRFLQYLNASSLGKSVKKEINDNTTELLKYLKKMASKNPDKLHQEIFQILQFLDNSIEQENSLLGQRINLFLLAQTFLIAGYIQSLTLPLTLTAFVINGIPIVIGITGFLTSLASHASIRLSNQAAEYHIIYYDTLKDKVDKSIQVEEQVEKEVKKEVKSLLQYYFKYYPSIYFSKDKQASGFAQKGIFIILYTPFYFCIIWFILLILLCGKFLPPKDTVNTLFTTEEGKEYVIIDEKYKGRTYGICFQKPCLLLPKK